MGRGTGVRAASETSIELRFEYRGVRCQERIKLAPTTKHLRYCEAWKQRIDHEIATGDFSYSKHFPNNKKAIAKFATTPGDLILLSDYLATWLLGTKVYVKASTWEGYRKIVENQIIPEFGHLKVGEIRRKHAKDWMQKNTATTKTLGNLISPLRVALDDAVEDELIDINPLAGWKIRRKNTMAKRPPPDPFSVEEQTAILGVLSGQALNFVQFAFWTGLRTSELVALEWSDIDWIGKTAHVSKALTQHADEYESPKTLAGERTVKLLPMALQALKRQKDHTYLAGGEVFQNPRTLAQWEGDQPIRKTMWVPTLKRAGVRYRKPYQTRHTYASMMLMGGEDVRWLATQLGHTDWAFTARTYTKWIDSDAPNAGSKVAQWFSGLGT